MKITRTPPAPRAGLVGEWDKSIGPGATRAELALILLSSSSSLCASVSSLCASV